MGVPSAESDRLGQQQRAQEEQDVKLDWNRIRRPGSALAPPAVNINGERENSERNQHDAQNIVTRPEEIHLVRAVENIKRLGLRFELIGMPKIVMNQDEYRSRRGQQERLGTKGHFFCDSDVRNSSQHPRETERMREHNERRQHQRDPALPFIAPPENGYSDE